MSGLGGAVSIIGTGTIKFGENFHQSLTDMIYEAVTLALADAGIERGQLQAGWLGCYEPMLYGFEGNSGTFVSDPLNLFPIPVTRVAAYCATGIEAVRNAALAVASGEYDLVLAVGAEKMREVPSRGSLVAQAVNRGHPVLAKGRTAPGMFALLASRYFKEYGADEEARGAVALKNHYHGSLNPKAHFQKEITPEQHARAPKVAEPLGLFDCCPTTDGAAAAILTRDGSGAEVHRSLLGCPRHLVRGDRRLLEHPVRSLVELHLVPRHSGGGQGRLHDGGRDESGEADQGRRVPRLLHDHRDRELRGPGLLRAGGRMAGREGRRDAAR